MGASQPTDQQQEQVQTAPPDNRKETSYRTRRREPGMGEMSVDESEPSEPHVQACHPGLPPNTTIPAEVKVEAAAAQETVSSQQRDQGQQSSEKSPLPKTEVSKINTT